MRRNFSDFNLAFVDTETTGLFRDRHEIIEIGLILVRQEGFKIIDYWETKIKPQHLETATPEALDVNGYDEKKWKDAIDPQKAIEEFAQKTRDTILVGHNSAFDRGFLDDLALKYRVVLYLHYHMLDTVSLAYSKLKNEPINNYGLSEIASFLGIEHKNAHTALG
ncbi:unnamed protein product, partial [marine sediment metagenome]